MMSQSRLVTRLAPSPTGELHLGNARTFLVNYALARQNGWEIVLRVEDIDHTRVRPETVQRAVDDLAWLGITWHQGPQLQSDNRPAHDEALSKLFENGDVYPCVCSRADIQNAASAPHAADGAAVYPGTCRASLASRPTLARAVEHHAAVRYRWDQESFGFVDGFAGPQHWNPRQELGDFVVAQNDGTPSYHLAVVVDDLASRVTHVVRGDDLLDSVPRQAALYGALGARDIIPQYFHLPLVVGPDGKRLAKRHAAELPADTRLARLRTHGVEPERVIGVIAELCGMGEIDAMTTGEFVERFCLERLPRSRVAVTKAMISRLAR